MILIFENLNLNVNFEFKIVFKLGVIQERWNYRESDVVSNETKCRFDGLTMPEVLAQSILKSGEPIVQNCPKGSYVENSYL